MFLFYSSVKYKQISYILLIIDYILQKYINIDIEWSRSFIAKRLFLNPNLISNMNDLILMKRYMYIW